MIDLRDNRTNGGSPDTDWDTADAGRSRLSELLRRWGGAPLMAFARLPDKRFLSENDWGVAYRAVGRHALALGDPLGDPAQAPEAVRAFLALCRRRHWSPVFYQVKPDGLDTYARAGLRAVKVGEDAQIELAEFALAGKKYKNLRNDLRRIEKAGVAREEYGPDAPPGEAVSAEMAALCAEWRRAHRAREGGFAMGGFAPGSALFRESRYFVARGGEEGRMLAFASFVPVYGPGGARGWTLDLMRRQADSPHGVMDFLIVSAAQAFAAEGGGLLSLGLSPLAGAGEAGESPSVTLVRRLLYTRMGRIYNFQGLHTFKAKFATRWEARYLICRPGPALAWASAAVLKAHLTPGDPAPRPLPPHTGRAGRTQAMALVTLLLLLFTPFEKTLAKRAPQAPVRLAARLPREASQMVQTWDRRSGRVERAVWRLAAGRARAAGARSFRRRS